MAFGATRLEIFKFASYVFMPIGLMALVDSPYFQDNYVRPYTLFPSAGKPVEIDMFPRDGETEAEWTERMKATTPIRKRAKEIYDQMVEEKRRQQGDKSE